MVVMCLNLSVVFKLPSSIFFQSSNPHTLPRFLSISEVAFLRGSRSSTFNASSTLQLCLYCPTLPTAAAHRRPPPTDTAWPTAAPPVQRWTVLPQLGQQVGQCCCCCSTPSVKGHVIMFYKRSTQPVVPLLPLVVIWCH